MPDVLHFSLNPGLAVESVHLDGAEAEFVHALGLVTVTLPAPVPAGARAELSIRAHGVPDTLCLFLYREMCLCVVPLKFSIAREVVLIRTESTRKVGVL